MRAALDHLVFQLAKLDDPDINHERTTQFPIFTAQSDFAQKGAWRIKMLTPSHAADITALQPYHRGNRAAEHPLARLEALSNHDKHRLVLTTAQREFPRPPPTSEIRGSGYTEYIWEFDPLEEKAKRGVFPDDPVEVETHLTIAITLDDGTRLKQIRKIGRTVNLVLDHFDGDFPSAATPLAPIRPSDWSYPLQPLV